MGVCGVIAFFMADLPYYKNAAQYPGTSLSSPYLPVILSMLASYIIAECFFNVRRTARLSHGVLGSMLHYPVLGSKLPFPVPGPSPSACWPAISLQSAPSTCAAPICFSSASMALLRE